MKAIGVIVEYNPFHNGHKHHLDEAKKLSKADCVIAVMSGNFVQRGEPAIINKWDRARLAIENGIDLVIELPFVYSVQSADIFAFGAIDILNKLKIRELYFGSESNDVDSLKEIVSTFNTVEFQTRIKKYLDEGNNYPSASGKTVYDLTKRRFTSNDNLGIQYINSISKLKSSIEPKTIQRVHSNYHDKNSDHASIASATAIRLMDDPFQYVPKNTYEALKGNTYTWNHYYELLQYKIISDPDLEKIAFVEEGIENRFKKYIHASSFEEFLNKVYTRRYTHNRIRRTLINILCNIKKDDYSELNLLNGAPYVRVLAMNENGRKYLNLNKKEIKTPIISKASEINNMMMSIEVRVTEIYDKLLLRNEFKPLIYNKN
ncbi:nucleotidyltransferase [Mycoplasmatota bacterium]|nr:nucleotidyltransferase [Mycoplasmatota bacterium]